MATSTLCLHRGATEVSVEALQLVPTPKPQGFWHPVGHHDFLSMVRERLNEAGFQIARERHALSRESSRYFGTIDLTARISDAAGGITLCCGLRNSIDRSLAAAMVMGSRCFVCDNMALSGSVKIAAKHSKRVLQTLTQRIRSAVRQLSEFQQAEQQRVARFQTVTLSDTEARSLMLQAFQRKVVSHTMLRRVLDCWERPPFEDFAPRTLFSLENCFTGVLADVLTTNPDRFAAINLRLSHLLTTETAAKEVPTTLSA